MADVISMTLVVASLSLHPGQVIKNNDLHCGMKAAHYEARHTSERGQAAIVHVMRNRRYSNVERWEGKSYCGLLYEPYQFSFVNKRQRSNDFDAADWSKLAKLTLGVMSGSIADPTHGSTHFCNLKLDRHVGWCRSMKARAIIGDHKFGVVDKGIEVYPPGRAPKAPPPPESKPSSRTQVAAK